MLRWATWLLPGSLVALRYILRGSRLSDEQTRVRRIAEALRERLGESAEVHAHRAAYRDRRGGPAEVIAGQYSLTYLLSYLLSYLLTYLLTHCAPGSLEHCAPRSLAHCTPCSLAHCAPCSSARILWCAQELPHLPLLPLLTYLPTYLLTAPLAA